LSFEAIEARSRESLPIKIEHNAFAARYDTAMRGLALHCMQSQSAAMVNGLPKWKQAILDLRKIEDYCLNPLHPRGRHKARVFREALGLQRSDASWLRNALLEAARSGEAIQDGEDAWGTYWRFDATVGRQGKSAVVRTIWIVRPGDSVPRFVTCWVLR
jgi:Domain of unknown function (DUF6883)